MKKMMKKAMPKMKKCAPKKMGMKKNTEVCSCCGCNPCKCCK